MPRQLVGLLQWVEVTLRTIRPVALKRRVVDLTSLTKLDNKDKQPHQVTPRAQHSGQRVCGL
jgi:hypothetical protein